MDAGLGRVAVPDLLADALEDEHVGIDRHAYGEHDPGDARQGQGRLQHGQQGDDQHQVQRQGHVRGQAETLVPEGHEDQHQDEADFYRSETLVDVVLAEAGAYRAFLDNLDGRGQGAGAQQQGQVAGFFGGIQAGDLEALAQLLADRGHVDHFFNGLFAFYHLAVLFDGLRLVFDEHHGHVPAHFLGGGVAEAFRALAVQGDGDVGAAGNGIETGRGVDDIIAGEHDLFLQQHRVAAAFIIEPGTRRHAPVQGVLHRVFLVGHAELQGRGRAQDVFGPGGVLHARQLHHHTLQALLLDDRFGHAQLVHALAQGGDVLLQGQAPGLRDRVVAEPGQQGKFAALGLRLLKLQVGKIILYLGDAQAPLVRVPEADQQAVFPAPGNGLVADALVAQLRPDVGDVTFLRLGDGRFHVHLHQEMHATAQVQAQEHGFGAEHLQPARRRRGQVEGHRIGTAQPLLHHVLGLELGFLVCKPHHQVAGCHADIAVFYARRIQGVFHGKPGQLADLAAPRRGDLQGRVLAVEVGQRVQATDRDDGDDQQVFPERIAVHGLLSTCVIPA